MPRLFQIFSRHCIGKEPGSRGRPAPDPVNSHADCSSQPAERSGKRAAHHVRPPRRCMTFFGFRGAREERLRSGISRGSSRARWLIVTGRATGTPTSVLGRVRPRGCGPAGEAAGGERWNVRRATWSLDRCSMAPRSRGPSRSRAGHRRQSARDARDRARSARRLVGDRAARRARPSRHKTRSHQAIAAPPHWSGLMPGLW
jgi:hypothetical protein